MKGSGTRKCGINKQQRPHWGHERIYMKEVIILYVLVLTTFYATFSEGAIRKVCIESISDNGTIRYSTSACKLHAPSPKL